MNNMCFVFYFNHAVCIYVKYSFAPNVFLNKIVSLEFFFFINEHFA